jgi:hypothetical protein
MAFFRGAKDDTSSRVDPNVASSKAYPLPPTLISESPARTGQKNFALPQPACRSLLPCRRSTTQDWPWLAAREIEPRASASSSAGGLGGRAMSANRRLPRRRIGHEPVYRTWVAGAGRLLAPRGRSGRSRRPTLIGQWKRLQGTVRFAFAAAVSLRVLRASVFSTLHCLASVQRKETQRHREHGGTITRRAGSHVATPGPHRASLGTDLLPISLERRRLPLVAIAGRSCGS